MTKEAAAQLLNNRQYRDELTQDEAIKLKESGLVAVFGASDDLMEFQGAIDEELGAYDGQTAYITKTLEGHYVAIDKDEWEELGGKADAPTVKALWNPKGWDCSWMITTDIPSAQFNIYEDDDLFCTGIVFALADLPA